MVTRNLLTAVAIIVAGVAIFFQYQNTQHQTQEHHDVESVIYAIGDLHGDVRCAKYWVERIGVVDNVEKPSKWLKNEASLVFMGDYIDKGPTSYETIEFVRSLTDRFPSKVVALMGNHEMELLKDRDPHRRIGYYQLPYAAVHPQEYLNYLKRDPDEMDDMVVDLLFNASLEIYAGQHYRSFVFAPLPVDSGHRLVTEMMDESVRPLVQERLKEYQEAYLDTFRSGTELGDWVEQLKVVHVQDGYMFCHGGVSESVASMLKSEEDAERVNKLVLENAKDDKFLRFIEQTKIGRTVHQMLTHRGNHKEACESLSRMLETMDGMDHLVVGHTPQRDVRLLCEGKFLAVDSLLGRWIRTSGNNYCPSSGRLSKNGRFVCPPLVESCEGQVVKIGRKRVEILYPSDVL